MTKLVLNVALTVALFTVTAFADGNMGGGGYTDCNGTNPPPTCCDLPTPPPSCGGFASTESLPDSKTELDFMTVVESIGDYILAIF